ncbi:hypothetical protein MTO96_031327 [Rhipicephalus appendiculatus]
MSASAASSAMFAEAVFSVRGQRRRQLEEVGPRISVVELRRYPQRVAATTHVVGDADAIAHNKTGVHQAP